MPGQVRVKTPLLPAPLASRLQSMYQNLKSDLIWNYASLGVLAASGVILNILVARYFGVEGLGVFNQVYSVYIIASQIAVGGIHYSVLRSVAQNQLDVAVRSQIVLAGVLAALLVSAVVATVLYLCHQQIGALLESPRVATGLLYVAPALVLFSLNKVLLAAVNGLQRMKRFALLQASRYIAIIATLAVAAMAGWQTQNLPVAFLVAELLTFCLSLLALAGQIGPRFGPTTRWLKTHFSFGFRGFMSGVLVDLNTRVDVLMLGVFVSDVVVGVYSLAAIIAEGLYQLLVVVRNLVNPQLAKYFASGDIAAMLRMIRRSWLYIYPAFLVSSGIALGFFYVIAPYLVNESRVLPGFQVLLVLATGIFIASGFIPYEGALLQGGRPGWFTVMMTMVVVTNFGLNLLLIPVYGMIGAAVATGITFVASAAYLNVLVFKNFRFSLLSSPLIVNTNY